MVDYGLLKGKVVNFGRAENVTGGKPHYHIVVEGGGTEWRCPVNVQSQDQSEVWFRIVQPLSDHPVLHELGSLPGGLKKLPERKPGLTLDYVREPLFDRREMTHLPYKQSGVNDDIQDLIEVHAKRAKLEAGSSIYVFGSYWLDRQFPPDHFFNTHNGVHDVHMNQGNDAGHRMDDGVYQDGGLIFSFPSIGWVGIFLAFDSQVWFTDSAGHPVPGHPKGPLAEAGPVQPPHPSPGGPGVSIIAALVNPAGGDVGKETVTLFNTTNATINLAGWRIADRQNREEVLGAIALASNTAVTIKLSGASAQLSNDGGAINLHDPHGVTVDAVTYSKSQASQQGQIIVF